MRPWEIARLTPRQVCDFYLCERDERGQPDLNTEPPRLLPSNEERFYKHWRLQGLRDDQIAPLWEAQKLVEGEQCQTATLTVS